MITVFKYGGLFLLAYLLGSIPFGLVLSALFNKQDIRRKGSGNIGATNVLRIAGAKLGLLTLFLDVFKGALPVFIAIQLLENPDSPWGQVYLSLIAISAFTGHLYPLYLGLRGGGKGVATAWGCFLIISPTSALVVLLVFVMMACASNRASIASLSGAVVLPMAIWYATHSAVLTLCAVTLTVLIACRHKDNIVRLAHGTESTIWGNKP
ncbi:MAG: glycerol-3-phosphate 1-O-acyltransferase PlsY [Desulfobacterales bacterium]|nr:glycerol-3-phosphate 1-O-acyltransferase PlsY [Desulfobacterales bacterium]MDX2510467.1 glycerol-3-phosphate 1-O-acyltransferase PlsY [Desulfobacterales bacterium]